MRKECTERYRSASEFADDIKNCLKGAPLLAGPPSTAYRLKKFVRRNRAEKCAQYKDRRTASKEKDLMLVELMDARRDSGGGRKQSYSSALQKVQRSF